MPKTLEKTRRRVPIKKEEKKTGRVMIPVEINTISVTSKERKEKKIGMMILAMICFNGETGRYLTMIRDFPSLDIDKDADALMTPENKRIKTKLMPETNSGK